MFYFIFFCLKPKASKAIHGLLLKWKILIGVGVVFLLATLTGVVLYNIMHGMFFTEQIGK